MSIGVGIPPRAVTKLRGLVERGRDDECWPWRGYTQTNGYGWVNVGHFKMSAHRLALLVAGIPVQPGLDACHTCDNRACCNPAHLYAGSRRQNMADCSVRHRHNKPRGERHWRAKLSEEKVLQIRACVSAGETTISLGHRFGVHSATISRIARRVWRPEVP